MGRNLKQIGIIRLYQKNEIVDATPVRGYNFFMDIKEIRMQTNMSQQKFADYFGIPKHSLQNWEYGVTKPPAYVINMIERILTLEKCINTLKPEKTDKG